ncbi:predicted protein [Phaeodactylum tricornutum CCAP 1055/1]|uniref:Tail specific protease domain-containing protein n=1 Tax=Phaeodactylum tricornutum (strain CCAP 1055/1) TaxID=556484 RepID=B7G1N7_PHATC|nr:predicted protein [Phaeodactylum tricornutum CCAP 1055/1]EEC47716.1 predicted protein [Phaeodactylum tricornutum CCAP 1055/1]|eukprot:XP_002181064.1 predicted protein [Phaeodactylum tricornutum CCAP 1055/1]
MGNQTAADSSYEDLPSVNGGDHDLVQRVSLQEYSSVKAHDEDEDDELSDPDLEQRGSPALRRRAPPSNSFSVSSFRRGNVLLYVWLTIIGVVALLGVALLGFRHYLLASEHQTTNLGQRWSPNNPPATSDGKGGAPIAVEGGSSSVSGFTVAHDPNAYATWNPYNLSAEHIRVVPSSSVHVGTNGLATEEGLGYLTQPSIVNNTVVFVSEGDLYLTYLETTENSRAQRLPAVKLTTTEGNVRTPVLHPNRSLVAFTATYTSRREAYVMDLVTRRTKQVSFFDSAYGVSAIAGWSDVDTLVVVADSNQISLPDMRLYTIRLQQQHQYLTVDQAMRGKAVLDVTPVPLAQATEGFFEEGCWYFVRFKQSSHTARYVGGTAEALWAYCDGQALAYPLTPNYNGTSKTPSIYETATEKYLLFLSDRNTDNRPSTMNLWATPLPTSSNLKKGHFVMPKPIQITNVACQMEGLALQEYAVDPISKKIVMRIGADLFELTAEQVQTMLQSLNTGSTPPTPTRLPVLVYSDFHGLQERIRVVNVLRDLKSLDVFETAVGTQAALLTVRGQLFVAPVSENVAHSKTYQGAGQNLPLRRYRVAPGTMTAGSMRVLSAQYVPILADRNQEKRRMAIVLATDPRSPTAEHSFFLLPIDTDAVNMFSASDLLPKPFLGGYENGGSTRQGGLGSVRSDSVKVSPCGRRMAWTDTDGRVCLTTVPLYQNETNYTVLPSKNELGEPINGASAELVWSPGGRYLAISHPATNQFQVISIVDCGDPNSPEDPTEVVDINIGRIVQATPSRFNSYEPFWGITGRDLSTRAIEEVLADLQGTGRPDEVATTLYFLSDRDIQTEVSSPWGSRAPSPYFPTMSALYGLPLTSVNLGDKEDAFMGRFAGGGVAEAFVDQLMALDKQLEALMVGDSKDSSRRLEKDQDVQARAIVARKLQRYRSHAISRLLDDTKAPTSAPTTTADRKTVFPSDMEIDFSGKDLTFARRAYRLAHVPDAHYLAILTQAQDDGSVALVENTDDGRKVKLFVADPYPSDGVDIEKSSISVVGWGLSTTRDFLYLVFASGTTKTMSNTAAGMMAAFLDAASDESIVDTNNMAVSIWPQLEYEQMYNDAWRMLRDYFYDADMHQVDWAGVHGRYKSLVVRCTKREELDDVLAQMASELSALHVFVYGGEYSLPFGGDTKKISLHEPASLGVTFKRVPEWKGYMITEIPQRDPDFNTVNGDAVYCPVSGQALEPTGQNGLEVGDVVVGVNGESVMHATDLHMLLRGSAGRSVRLEVLRLESGNVRSTTNEMISEPLIVVPITPMAAADLRYQAWEWRTRQKAKELAVKAGFSVAYIHMQSMLQHDMNAFARNFFPDYDAQALILDVRHNRGGNIDSWILTLLQRKAWMYWGDRVGVRTGDLDWDEQFAFRGHIVVLIDEHTASDGEGVSRGISELGLGRLVGTRTWGGGIWLSSDNRLVDGGIASAPEIGTFNDRLGWGMGIEQQGVVPDVEVDNNPRTAYSGHDEQLERAIAELAEWLEEEPVIHPRPLEPKHDMSLHDTCSV